MGFKAHICDNMKSNVAIAKWDLDNWKIFVTGGCKITKELETFMADQIKYCPYCGEELK